MPPRFTDANRVARATIIVHVPMSLRAHCAGASELALSATSLRAVLEELERRHPTLHRSICDETGTVRRHVNLFVNTNHMRDRLYMQNHGGFPDHPGIGVLRSDDHGHTWRSISKGLPSDFGFPMVVHPHDANNIYVVPLEPATRTCLGSAPAVCAAKTAAARGSSSRKVCRRKKAISLCCAMRWTSMT